MIFKKNLVLLGMMGSGKSTIGSVIAEKLNLKFVDTDKKIEKIQRISIRKIFETRGEKFFRNLEEKVVVDLLRNNSQVVSLGGGGFLNSRIKNKVLKNSISFWLNWKSETIIKRIERGNKRPKIFNLKRSELSNMIKKRSEIYKLANFKIECENLSKDEITENIIEIYENKKN